MYVCVCHDGACVRAILLSNYYLMCSYVVSIGVHAFFSLLVRVRACALATADFICCLIVIQCAAMWLTLVACSFCL